MSDLLKKFWQWLKKMYREYVWTSKKWLLEGDQQRKAGKLEDAVAAYDKAINKQNDNYFAWRKKAYLLHELNRDQEALECYNNALGLENKDPEVWFEKATILESQKEIDQAIATYSEVLKLDQNYLFALINQGNLLWNQEEYQEAKQCYEKVLKIKPNNEEIQEKLKIVLAQENIERQLAQLFPENVRESYQEVIKNHREAIKKRINIKETLIKKAEVLADLVDYHDLVKKIQQELEDKNITAEIRQEKVNVLNKLARELLDTAIEIYKSVLANINVSDNPHIILVKKLINNSLILNQKSPQGWWYKGRILKYKSNLSHLEMAQKRLFCYFKALHYINKGDKDYDQIYNEHLILRNHIVSDLKTSAQEHINHQEFKEAIHDFQESIKLLTQTDNSEEELINTYRMRGHLYSQLKLYDRALQDFDKALKISSENHYLTYCERGYTHHALKDTEKAIEDFTLAIGIKPSFDGYDHRGMVYLTSGEYEKAIEDFNLALEIEPSDGNCVYRRGFAHARLGSIQEAIDDFLEAAELYRYDGKIESYRISIQAMSALKKSHPEDIISPENMPEEISVRQENKPEESANEDTDDQEIDNQ
jgi:tetratricopeptide (TPR) repeat protein